VEWVEVCVESEGIFSNESSDHWYAKSCWHPRFKVEDFPLMPGAVIVRAYIDVVEDGNEVRVYANTTNVRVEP